MTTAEWLSREVAEGRLEVKPDGEVVAIAAAMIRARRGPDRKRRKREKA